MWVQEIEFDISQDPVMCLSEGGFQNVGETTVAELRLAAEAEFGNFVEDIIDPDTETRIGWKFRTTANYEDPDVGGEFQLETWIILHDEPPEMKFKYHVIEDSELADMQKFQTFTAGTGPFSEDTSASMPASVQEAMASLGMAAGDLQEHFDVDVDDADGE